MEEIYRSQFRLPYALYEQLKASADKNRRSVNAELVARLEESLWSQPDKPKDKPQSETQVVISQSNADSEKYDAASAPIKRGISKEKLLASLDQDGPVTKKDLNDVVMEAMLAVMTALKDGPPSSNERVKGPKPKKRYPKE